MIPWPTSALDAAPPLAAASLREIFPHVRVDTTSKVVEFDAILSPMLAPDPRAPLFFLEVLACLPDTREHETLVVCSARPSHIHAALLLIGLKPGEPGGWKLVNDRLIPVDPTGDALEVRFIPGSTTVTHTGTPTEIDPVGWIVSARDGTPFADAMERRAARDGRPGPGWVFTGSRIVKAAAGVAAPEVYDADMSGTVIGLTTFGSELIGWSRTISPDAGAEEPEWIAKMDGLPPAGSPVTVRVRPQSR